MRRANGSRLPHFGQNLFCAPRHCMFSLTSSYTVQPTLCRLADSSRTIMSREIKLNIYLPESSADDDHRSELAVPPRCKHFLAQLSLRYETFPNCFARRIQDLPKPEDDGACDHLKGSPFPSVSLPSTAGNDVDPSSLSGLSILFCYPRTGLESRRCSSFPLRL